MLSRLHVQGYKALRDIDTTLAPLTVIVGPNGCGKTSVLEAVALVRSFVLDGEDETRKSHPFDELCSKGDAPSREIEVNLWSVPADGSAAELEEHELKVAFSYSEKSASLELGPPAERVHHDRLRTVGLLLGATRLLELDVKAIARPSYSREITPYIHNDGSGLATVLSWLQGEQQEKFEEIQAQLREFVPEVERVRTRRAPVSIDDSQDVPIGHSDDGKQVYIRRSMRREEIGSEILFDFRHAKGVPAKHASEGTLLLLGLLTVALSFKASALLLDDVDRALHPKAQQQLVGYLRKLANSGVQVIATTHSPYLVLHLEYEEVRAMMMSDSGGALIGSLTDHPEYERWRESMTPSEFWTVFGEEWLAKAKAEGHG